MIQKPTPAKPSLRAQLRATQDMLRTAITNANNGTFVANAMFWKLGLQNREQCKAVVDEYMAFMTAKVAKQKETGSLEVYEGFLQTDATILAKVAEHADSAETDSE